MKSKIIMSLISYALLNSIHPTQVSAAEFMPGREYHRHYNFYNDCIDDHWIRLDLTPTVELGVCKPGETLQLARTEKSYPKMKNNPYEVQYWKGSFTRKAIEKVKYLHEVTNRCTGKTVVSEVKTASYSSLLNFQVLNPNLEDDVYASYQLVPMTEQEAVEALTQAKSECESYTSPVIFLAD